MAKSIAIIFLLLLLLGGGGWYWWQEGRREHSVDVIIAAAAKHYGVEPDLVKAVIWKESRFNHKARGTSGEIGLMQIMPDAAYEWAEAEKIRGFKPEDLFDKRMNIWAGTWYLRKCLRRFANTDRPSVFALAAYNAGPTKASSWAAAEGKTNSIVFLEQMTYPGTKQYVYDIVKRRQRYVNDFVRN